MWISRAKWEALEQRVADLETASVETADNYSVFVWPGYADVRARKIGVAAAIKLLAEHLNVRFRWHAAESKKARGSLEKVPRK
jgi:hypothetical protein